VVAEIEWQNPEVAVPAFLTMMAIPLTFSIANGLASVSPPTPHENRAR